MKQNSGYTLLELVVAMGILTIISLLAFVALQGTLSVTATSSAKSYTQANVRDVLFVMTKEIELAAKSETADDDPNLEPLTVFVGGVAAVADGAGNFVGDEIRYQIPLDNTGENWSTVISIRFENEDQPSALDLDGNGQLDDMNAILDAGEDTLPAGNGDGLLTRRIVRVQDLNADGDTLDIGEVRSLGGANDVSAITYTLNAGGDLLLIAIASTRPVNSTRRSLNDPLGVPTGEIVANIVRSFATTRVYLFN